MAALRRPDDLFARVGEWADLCSFAESTTPGLRIGIVSGRRRQGKSFLLRRLGRDAKGLYHQAQEVERMPALARFADDVAVALGLSRGQLTFGDWETAFRTALGYPERGSLNHPSKTPSGEQRLLIIDELPYLLGHSPEIPSVLQELYDESHDQPGYPAAAVIVCGSALSIMSELLSGAKALRGRAQLNVMVRPFDYVTASEYWNINDPTIAFAVDAVLGGTAGYKSLIETDPPNRISGLPKWLATQVLNPAHTLFNETDYLLREDPRISDKALYNSILFAVATGSHTTKQIGGLIGRDYNNLRHPLAVLESSGFLLKAEDLLTQKRPLYYLADPIVRFSKIVIEPYRALLEERDAKTAWAAAAPAFSAKVLGPHFEQMSLEWATRHCGDRLGVALGEVGHTVLNDPQNRSQHQLDVVALEPGARRIDAQARIVLLGEAKSTNKPRTVSDLARLEKIRELLVARGHDAGGANLALMSREGFDQNLLRHAQRRSDVYLIDLEMLYQRH